MKCQESSNCRTRHVTFPAHTVSTDASLRLRVQPGNFACDRVSWRQASRPCSLPAPASETRRQSTHTRWSSRNRRERCGSRFPLLWPVAPRARNSHRCSKQRCCSHTTPVRRVPTTTGRERRGAQRCMHCVIRPPSFLHPCVRAAEKKRAVPVYAHAACAEP